MRQIIAAALIAGAIVLAGLQLSGSYKIAGRERVFVTPETETYALTNFDDMCVIRIRKNWRSIGVVGTVVKKLQCQMAGADDDFEYNLVIVDIGSSAIVVPAASTVPID